MSDEKVGDGRGAPESGATPEIEPILGAEAGPRESDPVGETHVSDEPVVSDQAVASDEPVAPGEAEAFGEVEPPIELVETQHDPVEVGLQRSVRIGRILIAGIVVGAILGLIISLLFPVQAGADYELGQAAGVALVFGGVVGLALGALLALLLGIIAKRARGAAMAVQTDVR